MLMGATGMSQSKVLNLLGIQVIATCAWIVIKAAFIVQIKTVVDKLPYRLVNYIYEIASFSKSIYASH